MSVAESSNKIFNGLLSSYATDIFISSHIVEYIISIFTFLEKQCS